MTKRRRDALVTISVVYLALVVLWAVVMRGAEYNWFSTILLYAPQHIWLPVPFVLLLIARARKDRRAFRWNLLALVLITAVLMGFNTPIWHLRVPSGTPVRVMTWNMHHAAGGLESIAREIKRWNPDIVCLQEAQTGDWRSSFPSQMESLLPGWKIARFRELATLSKHPILSQEIHRMQPRTGRGVLVTAIDVEGRKLLVLNTHLSTTVSGSLFHRDVGVRTYMRHAVEVRSFQISEVRRIAGECKGAVVVMGDFNNPPRGALYSRMLRDFEDAFMMAGMGFGHTYRASLPVLRIDYVFQGDRVAAKRCFTPRTRVSDHRPVVADLVILGSDAEE